jgi:hypothetical protein
MTYNFDPDRWYQMQRTLLDARRERREIDDQAYTAALEALERKYEQMQRRLDAPFET